MENEMAVTVSEAWADLGPVRPSKFLEPRTAPSPEILKIAAELGLRYPQRNTVDDSDHAARVVLLAQDCADVDPQLLDAAACEWARNEPFFPRACELRERAFAIGRITRPDRILAAPQRPAKVVPPVPPLTADEIRKLPAYLIDLGVKVGEIDPETARHLTEQQGPPNAPNN